MDRQTWQRNRSQLMESYREDCRGEEWSMKSREKKENRENMENRERGVCKGSRGFREFEFVPS